MKFLTSLLLTSSLGILCALAEDSPGTKATVRIQPDKKGAEKIATPELKPPAKAKEPRIFFGGVFVDLLRGDKPIKPIDLRYPPKPRPVSDNVYTDPHTGVIKGFVLFAIKF